MDITTRMQHGVTLVVFAGSLDSNTSPKAQQEIDGVLGAGAKKVAIDCTGLDYISSAGLRVMLGTAKKLNGAGRSEERRVGKEGRSRWWPEHESRRSGGSTER